MDFDLIKKEELKLIETDFIIEDFTNEDVDKMLNEYTERVASITYICPTSFFICC